MIATTDRGNGDGGEGYTGTQQAARALNVSDRTVRRLHKDGEIEGRHVKRGRSSKVLEISIASLKELRDRRIAQGLLSREEAVDFEEAVTTSTDETAALARAFEAMGRRTQDLAARAAAAETRLEITARAESTVRADLAAERERRERAELEAEGLRAELAAERKKPRGLWSRWFG